MGVFLAVLADTWRQSKQQIVFLLVLGLMAIFSISWVFLCKVAPTSEGTYVLTLFFDREPEAGLETAWDAQYREVLIGEKARTTLRGPEAELRRAQTKLRRAQERLARARLSEQPPEIEQPLEEEFVKARNELEEKADAYDALEKELTEEADAMIAERAPGISPLHKGVQVWMRLGVSMLVYLAIIGFIASGSGYFPAMLASGAVDIIVSKPIQRWQIFVSKYLAGLVLMAAAVLAALFLIFMGMGFKTGIWHLRVFAALPVILFVVALTYALVLTVGVLTRSTPLAIVLGYIYYLVIEYGIWALQRVDEVLAAIGVDAGWVAPIAEAMRWGFPGFWRLHRAAEAAVLNVPLFEWQPLVVGTVWLVVLLGASYIWFERADF